MMRYNISMFNRKKTYSIEEITKHNTDSSCWIYANNKVYDVTEYIKLHPPQNDVILKNIKRTGSHDCTISYNFHSLEAKKIWDNYCIGRLASNTRFFWIF